MTGGSDESDGDGQFLDEYPWLASAGIGVATFVVEYVVIAGAFLVGPSSANVNGTRAVAVTYGHVLYNAHNVAAAVRVENSTAQGVINVNYLYGATGGSVPPWVYFLVPVVALLVAGAAVARTRRYSPGLGPTKTSADNAGELALGYLLIGIVGTFVFVRTVTASELTGTLSPNLPVAFGAFLIYPVVFGFLGSLAYLKLVEE